MWLAVGLIVGWLAGMLIRGGYGTWGNLIIGMVGAVMGGLAFGFIVPGSSGPLGSIVMAFFGAVLLLGVLRVVAQRRISQQ